MPPRLMWRIPMVTAVTIAAMTIMITIDDLG
jgi:hypothetical protein